LFAGVRAVVLGVPGAFTPVCTSRTHSPSTAADGLMIRPLC
jgi:peroxiredoxin